MERRLASPLETIRRVKFTRDAAQLLAAVRKFNVQALVLGLPLNMDGSEGPRAQATRAFVRSLAPLTDLPCCFWDERLSTAAVERDLIASDVSRAKRAALIGCVRISSPTQAMSCARRSLRCADSSKRCKDRRETMRPPAIGFWISCRNRLNACRA